MGDSLSRGSMRLARPEENTRAVLDRPKKWYNPAAG